ncbi:MAG TPA: GTPase HflX [Candidatus Omnitrophica bacterium]|nr:MAG: GTPase HflX [Omnitrophica WOR_2 bacterium GWA2_45_18]HBR14450.1 GTPase HflX [Candidatus Omnitrophota bacterium]
MEKNHKEKVLLVIVELKKRKSGWSTSEIRDEMEALVVACGGEVVGDVICPLATPTARYYIGEGKVKEIAQECVLKEADTVIFNHDLKGTQQRNLEESFKIKTIDRTQLILDIFARRATSREGKMQVELAQFEYLLPRLVGKGVELSRLGGGIGTLGPGETKLEIDRRRISEKITRLRQDLKEVASERALKRKKRQEFGTPSLSLVGYTNAGKSTLLNTLTQSDQETKDGLFTTLDSLSRQLVLPNHQKAILTDTVGFMHELPHRLVEAFKATLEEVTQADILVHVLDVSHPQFRNLYEAVGVVLKELEAQDKPTIVVLNKIDKLDDRHWVQHLRENFEHAVGVSAKTGENVSELLAMISALLSSRLVEINIDVPISRMDLVNLAHEEGQVISVKYYTDTINIRATVPVHLAGKFYK